jgi:hypothetical protein
MVEHARIGRSLGTETDARDESTRDGETEQDFEHAASRPARTQNSEAVAASATASSIPVTRLVEARFASECS